MPKYAGQVKTRVRAAKRAGWTTTTVNVEAVNAEAAARVLHDTVTGRLRGASSRPRPRHSPPVESVDAVPQVPIADDAAEGESGGTPGVGAAGAGRMASTAPRVDKGPLLRGGAR